MIFYLGEIKLADIVERCWYDLFLDNVFTHTQTHFTHLHAKRLDLGVSGVTNH